MSEQDRHPTGLRAGAYSGEGIWSYCPFREQARELTLAPTLAAQLQRAEDFCRDRLPDLFEHTGLSAPGGRWQVFPDRQLFKLTTASGLPLSTVRVKRPIGAAQLRAVVTM